MVRIKQQITWLDTDGVECQEEVNLPAKYIVCPICQGEGTRDNPAFDNGLMAEDFADPYFCESYADGIYDVPCPTCNGDRVVAVPDEERCDPVALDRYQQHCEREATANAEQQGHARYWQQLHEAAARIGM